MGGGGRGGESIASRPKPGEVSGPPPDDGRGRWPAQRLGFSTSRSSRPTRLWNVLACRSAVKGVVAKWCTQRFVDVVIDPCRLIGRPYARQAGWTGTHSTASVLAVLAKSGSGVPGGCTQPPGSSICFQSIPTAYSSGCHPRSRRILSTSNRNWGMTQVERKLHLSYKLA